ncbi:MAG: GIY-YIG nuclease family protein [Flavobacterium sp.]
MTHFLYILFSKSKDKYYIGETSDVDFRLNLHNSHNFKNNFTKIADDWSVVLQFECYDKNDALYLEAFIKRMESKKFILKIIDNKDILLDILAKK